MNIEGLKCKLQNRDFLDLLEKNEVMFLVESWMGLEKFEIRGNKSSIKGCCKMEKSRRVGGIC
jgi:hypothetical protein